jgi:ankyrin repeat protein
MGPNDHIYPDHKRSKSVSFGGQQVRTTTPGVRRWVSTSDASTAPSPSGTKREKFFSALRRLNTTSRATLVVSPSRSTAISPTIGSARGRRGRESEFTISIDLTTQSGRSAPDIVKAAQSGARYDVERLIGSGHDIEECHFQTRRNALMVAAHCGKDDIADLLIQSNAQLNRTDSSGSTALHLAASRDHVNVVTLLLMEAVNLEAEARLGRTALWVSANSGHLQTTQLLLENHAKVNARADNQMTALHVAARQGDVEIAGLLVSYGADVDARDASMMTALHYACEGGHLAVIELLLNNKANIDVAGSERRTPLVCAAATGQLSAVQQLIKRKSSVKSVAEGGMTAIHWAAFNGHVEIVGFLAGQSRSSLAWVNDQGRTALHLAALNSRFAVVELLVRKNCALETKCAAGLDSLHYACMADSVDIVRLLLTSGASIESMTEATQQRPIHIAAAGCSVGLVRQLCEKNASLEARDAEGDRALCVAARNGHVAAVQTLLDFGSPLHLRFSVRSHEDSPLCLAAKGGHLPVVSLLLSRGASVLSKDEIGWQPIRYAAYHGHPDVLETLIRADPSAAVNWDHGFSPDSFGMIADRIGFAPDASISSDRKRRVVELLSQLQRRPTEDMSRRGSMHPVSYADVTFPTSTSYRTPPYGATAGFPVNDSQPNELPGTLEQGLPSSRSTTPTHMHRGHQDTASTTRPPSPVPSPDEGLENLSLSPQPQILSPSAVRPRSTPKQPDTNYVEALFPHIETPRPAPPSQNPTPRLSYIEAPQSTATRSPLQLPTPRIPELDGQSVSHFPFNEFIV